METATLTIREKEKRRWCADAIIACMPARPTFYDFAISATVRAAIVFDVLSACRPIATEPTT